MGDVEAGKPSVVTGAPPGSTPDHEILRATQADRVVVYGRSTCPFCVEVSRTLGDLSVPFSYYKLDQLDNGPALLESLKKTTGQKTVPFVYLDGQLLGGCDATKALIASGEFDKRLGNSGSEQASHVALEVDPLVRVAAVDVGAPRPVGPLFEFPTSVDNRVIRMTGFLVFVVSVLITVLAYQNRKSWHWVAVGMLVDFALRFYAGAGVSPIGSVALLVLALADLILPRFGIASGPHWVAGPPKQFAAFVGLIFYSIIVALGFTDNKWPLVAVTSILVIFAALEAFWNFCAGCWVFQLAIRFKIIPDTVYMIHINTLGETQYAWEEHNKRINPPRPKHHTERFSNHRSATTMDLHYKIGKDDDWLREDFDIIRHVKIGFQSGVVGVAAVAAMFKFASSMPQFQTPDWVWQAVSIIALAYTALMTLPYLAKMVMYPKRIVQEWNHPAMQNAFSVPFMTIIIFGFLVEPWSNSFAKVLWWIGAVACEIFAVLLVGAWLSRLRHEGHINGAFQMAPVGVLIAAIVGPLIDPELRKIAVLWMGTGTVMYLVLFIFTFQRTVLGHNQDPRQRMFMAIWLAAPSAIAVAWAVVSNPMMQMDLFSQTMFGFALFIGFVLVWAAWRRFFWLDRYVMNAWALGFPTAALAWAGMLYCATNETQLTKILAVFLMSLASLVCFVLVTRTLAGIARLKVFIPEEKWGPMSHLPLAQEAQRHMLQQIQETTKALVANPGNTRLMRKLLSSWKVFSDVNSAYMMMKNDICFPAVGAYFPGHTAPFMKSNTELLKQQEAITALISHLATQGGGMPAAAVDSVEVLPGARKKELDTGCEGTVDGCKGALSDVLASERLVVLGRSTCPFCIEISRTLTDLGTSFAYIKMDEMSNGPQVLAALQETTHQKTVPYVFLDGKLLGGCDATKALIASGEFDRLLGAGGKDAGAKGGDYSGAKLDALQESLSVFATESRTNWQGVEDHVRPVVRRWVPGPSQKKIMNDCWDHIAPEVWFQVLPSVVQSLPMLEQRVRYLRAFMWAMPERSQQIGTMVGLGVDPVNWWRLLKAIPDMAPRGEPGWRHY